MFNVLILDESPVFRQGLKQILKDQLANVTVSETPAPDLPLDLLRKRSWDLVVVGSPWPERERELLALVKETLPNVKLLLLSSVRDHGSIIRAVHAGASGFLLRDAPSAEVVRAFRRILNGGHYITERAAPPPSGDALPHTKLSNREFLVLTGIAEGKRIAEIATELDLDKRTVSTYRKRLLTKMNMSTNAEVIRYAAQHGVS